MSTKSSMPNQHIPLHYFYGHDDCCLCKAEQEIARLTAELSAERERNRWVMLDENHTPPFRMPVQVVTGDGIETMKLWVCSIDIPPSEYVWADRTETQLIRGVTHWRPLPALPEVE